jgi:hypothetical protein
LHSKNETQTHHQLQHNNTYITLCLYLLFANERNHNNNNNENDNDNDSNNTNNIIKSNNTNTMYISPVTPQRNSIIYKQYSIAELEALYTLYQMDSIVVSNAYGNGRNNCKLQNTGMYNHIIYLAFSLLGFFHHFINTNSFVGFHCLSRTHNIHIIF